MINVVLFGALGCGKSSIINLLADEPIAQVSTDVDPCTKRPRWYEVSIDEKRFRLWDTMGFHLARGGDTNPLLPYEQAHAVLRNLTGGINLILLCARKDGIFASLGGLYWLISDFFYSGRAPMAFVVTQCDTPDVGWWERNQDIIAQRTGIPVHFIPHACITTIQTGCDQSKQTLKALLENYATTVPPITLRLDLSSYKTASLRLAIHCGLSKFEATTLVKQFNRPHRPFNVVFFGKAGSGKSSVINLLAGHPIAQVSSGVNVCTSEFHSYKIATQGMQQFQIWDTVGFDPVSSFDESSGSRAGVNAAQLIRYLSGEGGIDLIVFVKIRGPLTPSELHCYRLFEEVLCEGRVPVALVITHLESYNPMETWWRTNGDSFLRVLSGKVIGHACITSHMSGVAEDPWFSEKLEKSRLSIQDMLEDCVSLCNTPVKQRGLMG